MFIVLGLVLGIGVGFLTSLMRLRHPSLGASLAKFAGLFLIVIVALIGIGFVTTKGDQWMSLVTLAAVGSVALVLAILIALLLGLLFKRINHQSVVANSCSAIADIGLLILVSVVIVGRVAEFNRAGRIRDRATFRQETERQIQQLKSQLPFPYAAFDVEQILQTPRSAMNGYPALTEDGFKKIEEMKRLRAEINSSHLKPYRDENAHRSQLNWGMLAGWLVSVFVWPFVLPRLLKPPRAIH